MKVQGQLETPDPSPLPSCQMPGCERDAASKKSDFCVKHRAWEKYHTKKGHGVRYFKEYINRHNELIGRAERHIPRKAR